MCPLVLAGWFVIGVLVLVPLVMTCGKEKEEI